MRQRGLPKAGQVAILMANCGVKEANLKRSVAVLERATRKRSEKKAVGKIYV